MRLAYILVCIAIVVVLALAGGFGPYILCEGFVRLVGDSLEWKARSVAGSTAINCKRVEAGHDPTSSNACAQNAQALGKPFRVRYHVSTIDADISTGIVRAPDGVLYEMIFDGNPGKAGPTSLFRQRLSIHKCSTELRTTHGGRLTCIV